MYRSLGRTVLVAVSVQAALGAWLLVHPTSFAGLLDEPQRLNGLGGHAFGLAVILLSVMALPAAVVPRANRFLGLQVALGLTTLAVFFAVAGSGFWFLAAALVALGAAVIAAFWQDYRADLMSKP